MPRDRRIPESVVWSLLATAALRGLDAKGQGNAPAIAHDVLRTHRAAQSKPPEFATVWVVYTGHWGRVMDVPACAVLKTEPTRIFVRLPGSEVEEWWYRSGEGRQWFRTERAALQYALRTRTSQVAQFREGLEEAELELLFLAEAITDLGGSTDAP